MLREPFLMHGATASTGGCAVLVLVNGPVRDELSKALREPRRQHRFECCSIGAKTHGHGSSDWILGVINRDA